MHASLNLLLPILTLLTTPLTAAPLATTTTTTTTITTPSSNSRLYSETKPWHVTSLSLFTALIPAQNASYITFTFTDSNAGLELTTTCTRRISASNPPSSSPSTNATTIPTPSPQSLIVVGASPSASGSEDPLADATTWYPCANATVGFQYAGVGKAINVQRSYADAAVGKAPYDVVTAFGMSAKAVDGTVVQGRWGTMRRVESLEVKATRVIA